MIIAQAIRKDEKITCLREKHSKPLDEGIRIKTTRPTKMKTVTKKPVRRTGRSHEGKNQKSRGSSRGSLPGKETPQERTREKAYALRKLTQSNPELTQNNATNILAG
jgi:hypothetical protein